MKNIIVGEKIVKSFGEGEQKSVVLNDISVEVSEGEFVAIMGPSGSGKSSLMYALSGMDRINSGKIHFNGSDLSNLNDNALADLRRNKMGFVFQQPTLLKNLNLLDNIILPSIRDHRKTKTQIIEQARMLMEKAGILELENRDITQASGGQLQRVGICRALMNQPSIIFGDEPTGALNSKAANEIMRLMADIHQGGTTILLVTHDFRVAAKTERVLCMHDGKISGELCFGRFDGKVNDLKEREEKLSSWLTEMKL